jgi:hypothetical protein
MTTGLNELEQQTDLDDFELDFRVATASTDESITAPRMDGYTTYGTCHTCTCYSGSNTYTCGHSCGGIC